MTNRYDMKMPDLAATESKLRIIRWLVGAGEQVRQGQSIVEVESDKATVEVESVVDGTLVEIIAGPDAEVSAGEVIARHRLSP